MCAPAPALVPECLRGISVASLVLAAGMRPIPAPAAFLMIMYSVWSGMSTSSRSSVLNWPMDLSNLCADNDRKAYRKMKKTMAT